MHQSGGEAEGLELPEALLLDTSPAVLAGMSNSPDPSCVPMPHFQTTAQLPPLQRPRGGCVTQGSYIGSPERRSDSGQVVP